MEYLPDPLPITAKTGAKTTHTISECGNSSKPISVYAEFDANHFIDSSAGIRFNISNFTLDIGFGLSDTGISSSFTNGNTTDSFGLRVNLSEFKVGFESSSAVKWDNNTTETTYTNVSISGWAVVAVYVFIASGQPLPTPIYG